MGLAAGLDVLLTACFAVWPSLPFVEGSGEPCESGLGVAGNQVLASLLDPLAQHRREYRTPVLPYSRALLATALQVLSVCGTARRMAARLLALNSPTPWSWPRLA